MLLSLRRGAGCECASVCRSSRCTTTTPPVGYDYGTSLYYTSGGPHSSTSGAKLSAGRYRPNLLPHHELDCVGLVVTLYTPTRITFKIGSDYAARHYRIDNGDHDEEDKTMGIFNRRLAIAALCAIPFAPVAGSTSLAEASRLRPAVPATTATGHILFTRAGGSYGDETLFVARADGAGQRRISRFGVTCCPWATRDGSRIVFSANGSGGRISAATAHLDGTHQVTLTLPEGTLNLGSGPLSPDGKTIAREGFDDQHPGSAGIYLTRVSDGKIVRRLTRTHFIPGDFSPNGTQLVLFKGPNGNPPPAGSLWLVRSTGTGLKRLTPPDVPVQCCTNYRWSPDGRKILFADAKGLLWTIAPDGSNLRQVFKDANGRYAATPTWSPDGSMIMFALDPTANPFNHPDNSLDVIHADGTGLTQIIGGNDFKREPVWVAGRLLATAASAATGNAPAALHGHLLFTRTHGNDVQTIFLAGRTGERRLTTPGSYCCLLRISPNHQRILVMPGGNIPPPVTGGTINLAGRAFTRLPLIDQKLNLVPQAWSPDGKRIAFEGWDDSTPSRTGVYTANAADGTGLLRVTTRPGLHHDVPLDYSPDGKRLVIYRSAGVDPDPHVGGSLFVVGVDGSGLHRITSASARPADWARWSRNGDRIIFATQRTAPTGAIWTVQPDGSHLRKIFSGSKSRFPIQPIWSPDGTQILFALDPSNDQFTHPANTLYLARADGTHPRQLIGGPNFKSQPEWWR